MKSVTQCSRFVSAFYRQPKIQKISGRIINSYRNFSISPSVENSNDGRSEIILQSCWPDIEIPIQNVSDYCLSQIKPEWSSLTSLVCGETGKEFTFEDVINLTKRFGSQLLKDGLSPGDRVAVMVPNCPEFGPILFGAIGVGVTVVPISPLLTSSELGRVLDSAKPRLIITVDHLVPVVSQAQDKRKDKLPIISLTENSSTSAAPWEQYVSNDGSLYASKPTFDPISTLAILPFSSGTTGPPKGVMLTHQNLTSTIAMFNDNKSGCAILPKEPGDVQQVGISVIPMFHIYGLTCNVMQPLTLGVKTVSMPRFEPGLFVSNLAQHPPTFMNIVPPLVAFLAYNPAITREIHLSRVKWISYGASAPSQQVVRHLRDKLHPNSCEFKEGYGLTESVNGTRSGHNLPEEKRGTVGRIFPNTEAKVVNMETGETLGPFQTGELCLKGPQVTIGYLDNPEATDEALEKDGWFHTGDVVSYDEQGYFYIVDRIKDMIKVKGYQVSPSELEEEIRAVFCVLDVAVIGVKDEKHGEVPKAFIVLKPDNKDRNTEEIKKEINNFIAEKLSTYKQLTGGIKFLEELPKLPTGKVLRKELRLLN